ncbi:hypothetical protein O181_080883 [Austropuccinia psidii MF-1]|uniref:Uncharacterized protein n=1 Tax=Austropuccinia psidii MF-1 TaxID=1389203 RepID=A0A9Q3FNR7_9BASI|nr:hypothetical protein [Austropuccinia psidii MF-1]
MIDFVLLLHNSFVLGNSIQQCGNRFEPVSDNPDEKNIHCWNYGNLRYTCSLDQCHIGDKNTPINIVTTAHESFFFANCRTPNSKVIEGGWIKAFIAFNLAKTMTLTKWNEPNGKNNGNTGNLTCKWKNNSEDNSKRPWCNDCWRA